MQTTPSSLPPAGGSDDFVHNPRPRWPAVLAIFVAVGIGFGLDLAPGLPVVTRAAAVAVLMAILWVTEAAPLGVTAMLPVALFPLLGIQPAKTVAAFYFSDVTFLFLGGFLVALAMERWQLHRRVALGILCRVGSGTGSLLAGILGVTAFLSMWISNTAAAMMMLPIVMAILADIEEAAGAERARRLAAPLLLSVAYAASIGGFATLVGTAPNLAFRKQYEAAFPDAPPVTFLQWMVFALPLAVMTLGIIWIYFYRICGGKQASLRLPRETLASQLQAMGPLRFEERLIAGVFLLMALLWIFRAPLDVGAVTIPGWSSLLPHGQWLDDGTVAMALALPLFLIPARSQPGATILDWHTASKVPWDILLLIGGGFALGEGIKDSGLAAWCGQQMLCLSSLPPLAIVTIACGLVIGMSELTSNTATANLVLPILAGMAKTLGIHPLLLMAPCTIAASFGFMLPVGTPPNAIVFGTKRLTIGQMVRHGLALDLLGILLIPLAMWLWGGLILGIDWQHPPAWLMK